MSHAFNRSLTIMFIIDRKVHLRKQESWRTRTLGRGGGRERERGRVRNMSVCFLLAGADEAVL